MNNFDYYNPTQVLFGKGQIAALSKVIPRQAKVLMLYGGGSIKKNGVYDQVKTALSDISLLEFGGIEANPTYETLMQAVALVKAEKVDFLLAVGGGSVIDGTKFVAAAAVFDEGQDPWQILEKWGGNIQAALPFGCVLTLSATGSETNAAAVITRAETKAKRSFMNRLVFPKFAILDPTTSFSLPLRQVGNGVVDTFVHVVEQYLTLPTQAKVQERLAEGVLLTLLEEGPRALSEPDDYDVRANLMWAASCALNGQIGAGMVQDWATHMIGHELTALYGLDHAQTLAVVLPSMLRVRAKQKREMLLQYASRVWQLESGDEDERIELAITKTEVFFENMGVKTHLGDYGLNEQHMGAVLQALEEHKMTALGETRDVTLAISRQILEMAL
ncbi:MAG: iron-containing alcohol dehydrogenase [Burkholderiales bacterium]|nr:iron-containing alcohol dehydrogenase [Burkholderiales bacterium]